MVALLATAGWAEHPDGMVGVLLLPIFLLVVLALVVLGSRLANGAGDRSTAVVAPDADSGRPRRRWQVTLALLAGTGWPSGLVSFPASMILAMAR